MPDTVWVVVFDTGGQRVDSTSTDSAGAYTVAGLVPGSYRVCFNGFSAQGPSATGYASRCFAGQAWDGDDANLPAGATVLTVTSGALDTADETLPAA